MNKDVKTELKKMKKYANPSSSFDMKENKGHLTLLWTMEDRLGKTRGIKYYMGSTPSDWKWMKSHRTNLRKIFREKNIGMMVN